MTYQIERQRTGHFNLYIDGQFHSQYDSWSSAFNRAQGATA